MNSPDQLYDQEEPERKKGCLGLGWGCWVGIGCLGILLVCGGGGGGFFYFSYRVYASLFDDTTAIARQNATVQNELGTPINYTLNGFVPVDKGNNVIEFTLPINGPKGNGVLHGRATPDIAKKRWNILELKAEINGKTIPLQGTTGFEINTKDPLNQ